MTHALEPYRDEIDALIGPIEQILADLDALEGKIGRIVVRDETMGAQWDQPASSITEQVRGGLYAAMETLQSAVCDIDDYVAPEPEPDEEVEEPEQDDEDEDEDEEEES